MSKEPKSAEREDRRTTRTYNLVYPEFTQCGYKQDIIGKLALISSENCVALPTLDVCSIVRQTDLESQVLLNLRTSKLAALDHN